MADVYLIDGSEWDFPGENDFVDGHLSEVEFTENGIYDGSTQVDGKRGYSKVTVNVSGGGEPPVLIEKQITANGEYIAANDNANGYSKAVVNVPPGKEFTFATGVATYTINWDEVVSEPLVIGLTFTTSAEEVVNS